MVALMGLGYYFSMGIPDLQNNPAGMMLAPAVFVVTLLFAGGVTGLGENAAVTPLGKPEALSVVAELKPLRLVIVIVLVPFPPCVMVSEDGEAPIV